MQPFHRVSDFKYDGKVCSITGYKKEKTKQNKTSLSKGSLVLRRGNGDELRVLILQSMEAALSAKCLPDKHEDPSLILSTYIKWLQQHAPVFLALRKWRLEDT